MTAGDAFGPAPEAASPDELTRSERLPARIPTTTPTPSRVSSSLDVAPSRRVFTRSLRTTGNVVLSASGLLVIPPMLFLMFSGASNAALIVTSLFVFTIWVTSILERNSLWGNTALLQSAQERCSAVQQASGLRSLAFVGICTPSTLLHQVWHADLNHEDVGMLCVSPSSIVFLGDSATRTIHRADIADIDWQKHLIYGFLGIRWIRVKYLQDGQTKTLFIQSREKERLSQLAACNSALFKSMRHWWTRGSAAIPSRIDPTEARD